MSIKIRARIGALVVAYVLVGCFPRPAYELDLAAASWQVVTIDGEAIAANQRPVIDFERPDVDHATVATGCRSLVVGFGLESDSDWITFERAAEATDCSPSKADIDQAIVSALAGVKLWSIIDSDTVELRGGQTIRLERLLPSGS